MEFSKVLNTFHLNALLESLYGIRMVWRRNFLQFRNTFWVTITWIFLEPLLYLLAIGYGIGNYVSSMHGMTYLQFYFPALLSVTAFSVSFFESTYNYYTKLTHQKIYRTILLTPISPGEILWAELLWGAFKGTLSAIAVAIVGRLFDIYDTWMIIPSIGILFLLAFVASACGFLFTTFAKNYDFFNYAVSGFLLPMSFFSDTYFPIDEAPRGIQILIQYFPLIHAVKPVRALLSETVDASLGLSVTALIVFAIALTKWANVRFYKLVRD